MLSAKEAKSFEPVPPSDENVPAVANNARQWRLQADRADRLRQLGDDGRVIWTDRMAVVDFVNRKEDVAGGRTKAFIESLSMDGVMGSERSGSPRQRGDIAVGIRGEAVAERQRLRGHGDVVVCEAEIVQAIGQFISAGDRRVGLDVDQRSGGSLPSLKPGEILGAGALAAFGGGAFTGVC